MQWLSISTNYCLVISLTFSMQHAGTWLPPWKTVNINETSLHLPVIGLSNQSKRQGHVTLWQKYCQYTPPCQASKLSGGVSQKLLITVIPAQCWLQHKLNRMKKFQTLRIETQNILLHVYKLSSALLKLSIIRSTADRTCTCKTWLTLS